MLTHKERLRKLNKEVAALWRVSEDNHLTIISRAQEVEDTVTLIREMAEAEKVRRIKGESVEVDRS